MTVQSVHLDQRAEALGMARRDPAGEPPCLPDGVRVWIMDAHGFTSDQWSWADSAAWWTAHAWRAEDDLGNPVVEGVCDDDVLDGEMDGD